MNSPVENMRGIGPKTKDFLRRLNIHTVYDLSTMSSYGQNSRIQDLITRAKNIVNSEQKHETVKTCVTTQKFTKAHSWWEHKVKLFDIETRSMKEAVVYEFCIKPHMRCVFLCNWVTSEGILCKSSYSPQFLKFYNSGLPDLTLSLSQADIDSLPNVRYIDEILQETNTMINR